MSEVKDDEAERPVIAKTPTDLQRLKLEKLMKNPVSGNVKQSLVKSYSTFIKHVICGSNQKI